MNSNIIEKHSFFKNFFKSEKNLFILFILFHVVVWSCIGLIRTVLPTDSLEAIYWGSLHDFGTPKHPPLMGWIAYLIYLPFKTDYAIYLLSQSCIAIGFYYIYKIGKLFLNDIQAMLSVIILEGCWVYTYITGYYGFNPDVILLCMLPMITYYFYQCMHEDKFVNWLVLGILVGLSFLNKYQTAMLIIPMAIWAFIFNKNTFKNKFFYMSIVIAFLIFLPHLLWLFKYDFFPFLYFDGELSSSSWLNHISAPLMFILLQFALIAGVLAIFSILKLVFKSPFKLIENYDKKDFWFLLILGFGPIIIHIIMGAIEGGTMRPRWGFEFWYMIGIMLFYFFPTEISGKEYIFTIKASLVAMLITFLSLGTLLAVEKNYRSRYPVSVIYNDMQKAWSEKYNTPIKYIGGYIEWTLPITIYAKTHPDCILDTFEYPNPWIDENDLKKSGILIIGRTIDDIIKYTRKSCPYLDKTGNVNNIIEYKFIVKNAFNQPREYTIYYHIVPPVK